jgi:hypothetical protein
MIVAFPRFPESARLDADNPLGRLYTMQIPVQPGDSVVAAVAEVVDKTSTTVDPAPTVIISEQVLGLISLNLYGLTFRARGTGVVGDVYIRCRYSTALHAEGDDQTYVLSVRQG